LAPDLPPILEILSSTLTTGGGRERAPKSMLFAVFLRRGARNSREIVEGGHLLKRSPFAKTGHFLRFSLEGGRFPVFFRDVILFRFATLFWLFRVFWVCPQISQIAQKMVWLEVVLALIHETGCELSARLPPAREPDCAGYAWLPPDMPKIQETSRTAAALAL
jgi:hypothetical protein